jgi:hypothetical protein
VCFTLGTTPVHGVVIDDRGPIGANRVRIFRVRVPNDPYDEDVIEMPEDELALEKKSIESIPNDDVVNYLEHGGLIQILKANRSGGKNQPRVWLGRDSLGNVVHTFIAERGSVGGETIPFLALHDNRVFTPKRDEVLTFLSTFGLSKHDAKQVVKAVGTAP